MGFNEPNVLNQRSFLTPAAACALWKPVLQFAEAKKLRVVAPSVNDCQAGPNCYIAGKWLDDFFSIPGCGIDKVDAIAVKKYGDAKLIPTLIQRLHSKYQKPIWLIDSGPSDCKSKEQVEDFLRIMRNTWGRNTERSTVLERYAWGRTIGREACSLLDDSS